MGLFNLAKFGLSLLRSDGQFHLFFFFLIVYFMLKIIYCILNLAFTFVGMTRDDLFNTNASIVQTLTEACAK